MVACISDRKVYMVTIILISFLKVHAVHNLSWLKTGTEVILIKVYVRKTNNGDEENCL